MQSELQDNYQIKHMKKFLFSIVVALAAFVSMSASDNVTKKYENKDFVGLQITNAFSVEIVKSESYNVEVTVPEDYFQYVAVQQTGGKLSIGFKDLPRKLRSFKSMKGFKAYIAMPELYSLQVSGSSKVECHDTFSSEMRAIAIECSGSSRIENLDVTAPSVTVDLSGASRLGLNVKASDLKLEVDGASKLALTGEADAVKIKLSGASSIDAEKFTNKEVDLKQSGASKMEITIGHALSAEISGASRCVYYSDGKIDLDLIGVTGASIFKKGEKK